MPEKKLSSDYTVRVRGRGPFAFDHITSRYPFEPEVERLIELATGDTATWPYDPPEEVPPPDDEDWELYVRYKSTEGHNQKMEIARQRERVEFFKVNCVDVARAPAFSFRIFLSRLYKWVKRILGQPVLRMPFQRSYITWFDTEVIRSEGDWMWIVRAATVREVTLDSVLEAAARSFPGDVRGETAHIPDDSGSPPVGDSEFQHEGVGSSSRTSGGEVD